MILRELQKSLASQDKTLIDTTLHTDEFLTGYDWTVDLHYLNIKYGTLELVSEDIVDIMGLVEFAFKNNAYKWNKLWDVTKLEYNPIWNYDGTTTTTEARGKRKTTNNYGEDVQNSEDKQAPFDSSTYRNGTKNTTTRDEHEDTSELDAFTDTITEVRGGNQGTTTTQQMMEEERKIAHFKMWDIIMADIVDVLTYPMFGGE